MESVPEGQETSRPAITMGARTLLSYNISHFVLPPNIARAIINAATERNPQEDVLRYQARPRETWGVLGPRGQSVQGPANNAANKADLSDTTGSDADAKDFDMDLFLLKKYLDGLGSLSQEHNRSALANMCQYVLGGEGAEHNFKKRTVKMIVWQELQLYHVKELITHLVAGDHIAYNVNQEARKSLVGYIQDVVVPIVRRFHQVPEIEYLQSPTWEDGYLDVFFEDAFMHLVRVIACNQLLRPSHFDLDSIETVIDFLRGENTDEEAVTLTWHRLPN